VLVDTHQTSAVHGDFTVVQGLKRLLEGSGLSFTQVRARTIAINVAARGETRARS
jgi:Secretin and TonB N terminus short domain